MDATVKFNTKVKSHLDKISRAAHNGLPVQVLLHSDKNSIDIHYSNTNDTQPFHIASIGKMFTATLVGILHDRQLLHIDDAIIKYLENDVLRNLFVFEEKNYESDITIRQLLSHSSGVNDYFEGKVASGAPFIDRLTQTPEKIWTPTELIAFTQENQSAIGSPGTFDYTDTGYILLGLIIEKVTQKTFSEALEDYIFKPLKMDDSYLMFYGKPVNHLKDIASIYLEGKKITHNMLSCDWAGGGIVSTTNDLLKFQQAFWQSELVSENFRDEMTTFTHKYRSGIHYGLGMMEIRFNEFFFLLRGLPRLTGHTGVWTTHMYYDSEHDLHIIMNFGTDAMMNKSFRLMIAIAQAAKKYLSAN